MFVFTFFRICRRHLHVSLGTLMLVLTSRGVSCNCWSSKLKMPLFGPTIQLMHRCFCTSWCVLVAAYIMLPGVFNAACHAVGRANSLLEDVKLKNLLGHNVRPVFKLVHAEIAAACCNLARLIRDNIKEPLVCTDGCSQTLVLCSHARCLGTAGRSDVLGLLLGDLVWLACTPCGHLCSLVVGSLS